ncbi:glycosyltransferase family 1 protein [Aquipuribacter sp. MA13-6]|uniref:glycosyltransferase family 1 protein n=1 Tax=unclassified Aquipuribacter TaxID=2635084 RepID=UPI003EEFA9F1
MTGGGATGVRPRVVHVPDGHAYVTHVSSVDAPAPRLPRFSWDDGAAWVREHAGEFDVLHLHFGFEQVSVTDLRDLVDALAEVGRPLVWTAHDLTNPHLVDQTRHEQQLAVLAEHAAVVLTLTRGAAEEIRRRWGRDATVVPHPHLAPTEVLARTRPRSVGAPVIGLHLGMLRPSTDRRIVLALLDAVTELPTATLRVHLREEVLAAGFPRPDRDLFRELHRPSRAPQLDLRVGGRMPEPELWDELSSLSALVLPYRWGTHSGWVESCYDVGTPVVAPEGGRWSEQQPVHTFRAGPAGPDRASLVDALRRAVTAGPRRASVLTERVSGRARGVHEHDRVHRLAAAGGRR